MWNPRQIDPTRLGVAMVLTSTVLFALMGVSGRVLRADYRADSLAVFRFLFQTAILLPWALQNWPTKRPLKVHFVRSVLGVSTMLAYYGSLRYLPLGMASLLAMSSVLWATGFGHFFLKERVEWAQAWAGGGVVMGMLLCLVPGEAAQNWVWHPLGVGLALGAGLTMGAAKAMVKGMRKGTDPREIVFYFGLFGFAFCLPTNVVAPEWPQTQVHWWLLLAVSVCGTGGQLLFTTAFRYISILLMSALSLLGTLLNVAFGFLLLEEVPPLSFFAGASLVLAGIFVITRHRPPRPEVRHGLGGLHP